MVSHDSRIDRSDEGGVRGAWAGGNVLKARARGYVRGAWARGNILKARAGGYVRGTRAARNVLNARAGGDVLDSWARGGVLDTGVTNIVDSKASVRKSRCRWRGALLQFDWVPTMRVGS